LLLALLRLHSQRWVIGAAAGNHPKQSSKYPGALANVEVQLLMHLLPCKEAYLQAIIQLNSTQL
jgi:hypothetical protein